MTSRQDSAILKLRKQKIFHMTYPSTAYLSILSVRYYCRITGAQKDQVTFQNFAASKQQTYYSEPRHLTRNSELFLLFLGSGSLWSSWEDSLSIFKKYLFIFIYLAVLGLSCGMWDLFPSPEIELQSLALGAWSLSHWTTREVPRFCILDPAFLRLYRGWNWSRGEWKLSCVH